MCQTHIKTLQQEFLLAKFRPPEDAVDQKRVHVFHQGLHTPREIEMKAQGRRPSAFIGGFHCRHVGGQNKRKFVHVVCIKCKMVYCFEVFVTPDEKRSTSVWAHPRCKNLLPSRVT